MSDYIERVKAIETVKFYDGDPDGIPWAIRSLNDIPAADVVLRSETCPYYVHNENDRGNDSLCGKAECEVEAVRPVVRGKWEQKPDPYGFFDEIPVCSSCGCTTKWRETYLFCPNCGADMRGDEDV